MNKKVFTLSIIDNKLPLFICFCFLSGTIMSFYLSISISDYFYFLSVPVFLLTLYLVKLTITQVKNEYKRLIKKEKYLKDGCHLRYFDNNKKQVKFELHIINGERNGSYKSYYENGQIELECNYINGELDGIYKSYFINGQIEIDCNYINGKKHGLYKTYYVNGNLKNELYYKNGNEDGQFHSFYANKANYREGDFDENGLVKEYFKNGNLKFLKDKNKYTFYDEDNNLKCETHIEDSNSFFGKWKNYREDGTIEYELDFDDSNSDKVNNKVVKTIFTKGGEIFSKNIVSYSIIKMAEVNFINYYANIRMDQSIYSWNTGLMGPPGISHKSINLKPITSIEDIIKLTPIKDFENE